MSDFVKELRERGSAPDGRRWTFVPYDQLSDQIGPLSHEDPEDSGIVLVENSWKATRRPYHRQKLALVLSNQRHFALDDVPLSSREGFIRQILGWREFVRHVHRETDGFRQLPEVPEEIRKAPGDGGYSRWRGRVWKSSPAKGLDGGAAPSRPGADRPIPPVFWGEKSGLACLDTVVATVWGEAHSHHITRLMILSNVATLLDLSPRDLADWFWVAYDDAYDWVVEPNVLGMGTFATGDLMTTKPYVSGANYISRMSDYCGECAFDPEKNCPLTPLYWAFLSRHRAALEEGRTLDPDALENGSVS